jgi:hypothetical protein
MVVRPTADDAYATIEVYTTEEEEDFWKEAVFFIVVL